MDIKYNHEPERARPRILLVEDEAGVRRSLQLVLQALGLDVRSYATSSALLSDPNVPDAACMVVDYRLGDLNGAALVKELRARGWAKPAVMITAFPSKEMRAECQDAGVTVILEKPFRDNVLKDTVLRCVSGAAQSAETGSTTGPH